MTSASWYLYIIETECGMLYTGITTDLDRRLAEHQGKAGKKKGAKFFRGRRAKSIRYAEKMADRSFASKREYEIKKLSATAKRALFTSASNLRKESKSA